MLGLEIKRRHPCPSFVVDPVGGVWHGTRGKSIENRTADERRWTQIKKRAKGKGQRGKVKTLCSYSFTLYPFPFTPSLSSVFICGYFLPGLTVFPAPNRIVSIIQKGSRSLFKSPVEPSTRLLNVK
jgi:hypothetical protein